MADPIRVMIVDDSAVVRETLRDVLESDPQIKVIATAADPLIAAKRLESEVPDVITLDIEMPRLDGLSFLKALMQQHPLPVVICSSQTAEGSANALKALEYGAVDIIRKPMMGTKVFIEESRTLICDAVKAARYAHQPEVPRRNTPQATTSSSPASALSQSARAPAPKLSADVMLQIGRAHV